ncbi:DUF2235 domain-containing protein [Pectobacterium carotovorum]|uniref:T6SS phospholipase effector Tle1-like catalytic domain-containing protein n=1 Tax=Pectobacterium carotovorum TaxID=554 RepID=UPI0029DC0A36|nr:DUF2235 domain-containing protein [Pectobacterium carotovorum]MDX6914211.1 DUF2235 domain-containing protein [Pectobacterium carotovorum]
MDRRIVICCDGTGNELNRTMSNVLKFYRILEKKTQQQVFYTPGVGTLALDNPWQRFKQQCRLLLGLGAGYGLDNDVLKAYDFLCQNWHEGDKIYLLGFSRGAYTVRVVAALVETIGIIPPGQRNLAEYGLTAYKKASGDRSATAPSNDLEDAWLFGRIAGGRPARIEFIGVWDTVSSVIVPRSDRLLPSIQTLRFTRTNKAVKCFRQAISMDERRRMFRLNRWIDPQPYRPVPYRKESEISQDIQQVWFAGVHADVGGGYPESESGLSKYPLIWMLEEAQKAGLTYDEECRRAISKGGKLTRGGETFVPPDATGILHRSLRGLWWLLEYIPKNKRWREWCTSRPTFLGRYLPLGEPRAIPPGSLIHASVRERMAKDPHYRPINLNGSYQFTDDVVSEPQLEESIDAVH